MSLRPVLTAATTVRFVIGFNVHVDFFPSCSYYFRSSSHKAAKRQRHEVVDANRFPGHSQHKRLRQGNSSWELDVTPEKVASDSTNSRYASHAYGTHRTIQVFIDLQAELHVTDISCIHFGWISKNILILFFTHYEVDYVFSLMPWHCT
jgi:hypothetical protein